MTWDPVGRASLERERGALELGVDRRSWQARHLRRPRGVVVEQHGGVGEPRACSSALSAGRCCDDRTTTSITTCPRNVRGVEVRLDRSRVGPRALRSTGGGSGRPRWPGMGQKAKGSTLLRRGRDGTTVEITSRCRAWHRGPRRGRNRQRARGRHRDRRRIAPRAPRAHEGRDDAGRPRASEAPSTPRWAPGLEISGGSAANTVAGMSRHWAGARASAERSPTTSSARCSATTSPLQDVDARPRRRRGDRRRHRALPRPRDPGRAAHHGDPPRRRQHAGAR